MRMRRVDRGKPAWLKLEAADKFEAAELYRGGGDDRNSILNCGVGGGGDFKRARRRSQYSLHHMHLWAF